MSLGVLINRGAACAHEDEEDHPHLFIPRRYRRLKLHSHLPVYLPAEGGILVII